MYMYVIIYMHMYMYMYVMCDSNHVMSTLHVQEFVLKRRIINNTSHTAPGFMTFKNIKALWGCLWAPRGWREAQVKEGISLHPPKMYETKYIYIYMYVIHVYVILHMCVHVIHVIHVYVILHMCVYVIHVYVILHMCVHVQISPLYTCVHVYFSNPGTIRNFLCRKNCWKVFYSKSYIVFLYSCTYENCSAVFGVPSELKKHEKTHRGMKILDTHNVHVLVY